MTTSLLPLTLALLVPAIASVAPVKPQVAVGGTLYAVTPCRFYDSRKAPEIPMVHDTERPFKVAGSCGVPNGAKAVMVNITVTQGTGPGHIALWSANEARPQTSVLNFGIEQDVANQALVLLGDSSQASDLRGIAIVVGVGSVHLVLDVVGYLN